jgi:hypothetical protein
MSDTPRRAGAHAPGTPLLLDEEVLGSVPRAREFAEFSGIPMRDLLVTPVVSHALPLYNFGTEGRRRWEGVKPEAMWHPLLWLPSRLAGRYSYADATGQKIVESDEVWAIRVAVELQTSGIYDVETGTWVDVLAMIGLDADDEMDMLRVQDWLDGTPDADLDAFSFAEYLAIQPQTWALESAVVLEPMFREASYALTANELIALLDYVSGSFSDGDSSVEDILRACRIAASTGLSLLSEAVADENRADNERFFLDVLTGDTDAEDFTRAANGETVSTDRLSRIDVAEAEMLHAAVAERLYDIRDLHWGVLASLHEEQPA